MKTFGTTTVTAPKKFEVSSADYGTDLGPGVPAQRASQDRVDVVRAVNNFRTVLEERPEVGFASILPLIFRLKGKPFDIVDGHFLFEHEFVVHNMPRRQIDKAGRQVAKSTNKAAGGIIRAAARPYYNLLTVTPLFEQIRKFSNNYVKPFLRESAVRSYLLAQGSDQQVLQRTLSNGSTLFYNYASNSADRIRGTPADEVDFDELQDFELDVLPVIQSCLDASPYKIERYSGTPKTFDNPLQVYWDYSSKGVWHIPCQETGCKHENRCTVADEGDLLKMIGDGRRRKDGRLNTLLCAKCGNPVNARLGYFIHAFPNRRLTFAGFHKPQILFPMHYESALAWDKIMDVARNKPKYLFYNEVLGESIDVGQKLITIGDLKAAGIGKYQSPSTFDRSNYIATAVGTDWGGKGKEKVSDTEEFISNTSLALGGIRGDGVVEITWGYQTQYSADHFREAGICKEAAGISGADIIAHDYGGAGDVRESILIKAGWPAGRILPFTYVAMGLNKNIVTFTKGPADARASYSLDKARSLLLLCELIKAKKVIFPEYTGRMATLMNDFLAIYQEKRDNPRGGSSVLINRIHKQHDDFVHAVNFVVMGLFHRTGKWPNMGAIWEEIMALRVVGSDGTEESDKPGLWLPADVR